MANKEDIDHYINTILRYCGFVRENNRISIAQDEIKSFEDILSLAEKDVSSLAKGFVERTVANRKFILVAEAASVSTTNSTALTTGTSIQSPEYVSSLCLLQK
jgi:hypothetical protein